MYSSMKLILVVFAIILACVHAEEYDRYDSKNEKYSSKYDNMNLDEVLGNKRLLNGYMKCALDQGPCTAEGKELKCKRNKIELRLCNKTCIHPYYCTEWDPTFTIHHS